VTSNLLHILRLRVHDDLGSKGEEDVFEEIQGEVEASEVVSVLEDLEDVAWKGKERRTGKKKRKDVVVSLIWSKEEMR